MTIDPMWIAIFAILFGLAVFRSWELHQEFSVRSPIFAHYADYFGQVVRSTWRILIVVITERARRCLRARVAWQLVPAACETPNKMATWQGQDSGDLACQH